MSKKWITFVVVACLLAICLPAVAQDHGPPQSIALAAVTPDQAIAVQAFREPHMVSALFTQSVTFELTAIPAHDTDADQANAGGAESTGFRQYRRWEAQAMKLGVSQPARPLGTQPGLSRNWTARGRSTWL